MSGDFLVDLLTLILREQGIEDAHSLALKAAGTLRRSKLVDPKRLVMAERDATIYRLRAVCGVKEVHVAARYSISTRMVRNIVKKQIALKRSA